VIVAACLRFLERDRAGDHRFDKCAGEQERNHAADRTGQQAPRDYLLFHLSAAAQWQGKPRR
jgi:hypothetical protein